MSSGEVIVIGAGVIGLSTAVFLRRRGYNVMVLEANEIGSGSSAGNAGWIVPALAAPIAAPGVIAYGLRHLLDRSSGFAIRPSLTPQMIEWVTRFAWATRSAAFEEGLAATSRFASLASNSFAKLVESGLSTSIQTKGMLVVHSDPDDAVAELRFYRRLREYGVEVADSLLDADGIKALEPTLGRSARAGIWFPGQQYVDPLELARGLGDLARREGVVVREHTPVLRLSNPSRPLVHTDSGDIFDVATIVIAAGYRSTDLARSIGFALPMKPGKGYSTSILPTTPLTTPVYIPKAKAALTPLNGAVRIAGVMELGRTSLSISGSRLTRMCAESEQFFADDFAASPTTDHPNGWVGLRPVTADSLPVIGSIPGAPTAYIASGHAMLGVTLASVTGEALAALINGEPQPLLEPFRPHRFRR